MRRLFTVILILVYILNIYGQEDILGLKDSFIVDTRVRPPIMLGCFYFTDGDRADDDLFSFLCGNFIYATTLLQSEAFGVLTASWIVEKDSTISSPKIIKDIGYGSGEELLRILNQATEESFKYASPLLKHADKVLVTRDFEFAEGILTPKRIPRFPGCENLQTSEKRIECADKKLDYFIYKNLVYPKEAKEKSITGSVTVSWIVDKNNKVIAPEIIQDIGNGCGKEILRVFNLMNEQNLRWTPASSRYPPIRVKFTKEIYFTEEMLNRP